MRLDGAESADTELERELGALLARVRVRAGQGRTPRGPGRPARAELRSAGLWRDAVCESAASFVYVTAVCGAASGAGVGASTSAVLLCSALAAGAAVATLALCFDSLSGSVINPAVSVSLALQRELSPLRAALYVAAQCGGALAAAALLYGAAVPGQHGGLAASLWGAAGISTGAVWARLCSEAVLTALVVAAHCAAGRAARPELRGLAYCAATLVSMPHLNPARSLGPAFVLSRWEGHWVQWAGPLTGGAGVALLREWAARRRRPPDEDRDDDEPDKRGSYCPAPLPRPPHSAPPPPRPPSPLYGGTRSLYCRSPPPARHAPLMRSHSVYSKCAAGDNADNMRREPVYGAAAPAPTPHREELYAPRRPPELDLCAMYARPPRLY